MVKVALDGGEHVAAEKSRLSRLGPAASLAGAVVPELLGSSWLHGRDLLVQTRVDGEILAPVLMRTPERLTQILGRVCAWLEEWGRATAAPTVLTRAQLEREVLGPAEALVPDVSGGSDYLAYLQARCSEAEGSTVNLTASHNDLTMSNVLLNGDCPLGIVDWEAAEDHTLPMRDFPYAVVDAVAATRRYEDRPGAARACFEAGGAHAEAVASLRRRQVRTLSLPNEVVELSFHACWLGHAVNERAAARTGEPMPFGKMCSALPTGPEVCARLILRRAEIARAPSRCSPHAPAST